MTPLLWQLAPVVALVSMGVVVVRSLKAGSRLARRLFLLFLLLSWSPALLVLAMHWQLGQRQARLADNPGLRQALESSLSLARSVLEEEGRRVQAAADSLAVALDAGGAWPPGPARVCVVATDGHVLAASPTGAALAAARPGTRVDLDGAPHVVGRAATRWRGEPGEVRIAWPLDPGRVEDLAAIEAGYRGTRQIGLFYGDLLRADTLLTLFVLTLVVLGGSLALSRALARRIGGPLRELAAATAAVADGDLDHVVRAEAVDELGDLVDAFNRMTGQLRQSKEDLVRTERIAAWQGIARRLAHEIKNPLTPIGLSIHRLRGKVGDDPVVGECLDAVLEETQNLQRLADEFSSYARLPAPVLARVRVRGVLEQVAKLYAERAGVSVQWESWPEDDVVEADEGQLRQVFSNVIKNAVEAMGRRGAIQLRAARSQDRLCIEIQDEGPGLPAAADRLFEPDFTTKASGTGLGLAIARKILQDHRGGIHARSAERGSVFAIELPCTPRSAS